MQTGTTCDEVRKYILDYIQSGNIATGQRLPSFRSLCNFTNSSITTVQRAVAMLASEGVLVSRLGSGTYVSSPPHEKMGSNLIGVLVPTSSPESGNFISDTLSGLRNKLQASEYYIVQLETPPGLLEGERVNAERDIIDKLLQLDVAGLIVALTVPSNSSLWQELKALNIPVVCFNNQGKSAKLNFVGTDNYVGGDLAASHFCKAGHSRLAVISINANASSSVLQRIDGFRDCLARNNIALPDRNIIKMDMNGYESPQNLEHFLIEEMRTLDVTGIFAINDGLAVKIISTAKKHGMNLPEDISVIGFDNSILCEHLQPRLTSISQPSFKIGTWAAEILLQNLSAVRDNKEMVEIKLQPELVSRDSVFNFCGAMESSFPRT